MVAVFTLNPILSQLGDDGFSLDQRKPCYPGTTWQMEGEDDSTIPQVLILLVVGHFKKTRRKSHKLYCSPCQEAKVDGRKSGLWSLPDPVGCMGILTQPALSPTLHFWKRPHFPNEAVPLPLRLLERMKSCVFASSGWRREMLANVFSFLVLCHTFCGVPSVSQH